MLFRSPQNPKTPSIWSKNHLYFVNTFSLEHVVVCLLYYWVFSIWLCCAFSQDYNFILCLCILPTTKDKHVWSDRSASVAESTSGWVPDILALLPGHGVRRPDHEVVAAFLGWLVLKPSSRSLCPASEQENVGATDVHGVAEPVLRWYARDSESAPHERFSVEHPDVVQVAFLESTSLSFSTCVFHVLIAKPETAVNHKVCANQN